MRRPYWDYYRTIEDDLIVASRYVEFVDSNYDCYSLQFARLLLAAGSELDMVFKILCKEINPSSKAMSIGAYYREITQRFPNFPLMMRYARRFKLKFRPFAVWTEHDAPYWWTYGYNKVKHHRDTHFHTAATLRNTLNAAAALQIVLFHLYLLQENSARGEFGVSDLPRLFVPAAYEDRQGISTLIDFMK